MLSDNLMKLLLAHVSVVKTVTETFEKINLVNLEHGREFTKLYVHKKQSARFMIFVRSIFYVKVFHKKF